MSARTEILRMADMSESEGRSLTAPAVVEMAKNAEAWPELNRYLWQTPEADLAMEARIQRVHRLLIQIKVTNEEGTTTRMMVHTAQYEGYRPLSAVSVNRDFAAAKLSELASDIGRARARLRAFRAAISQETADEIDAALERAEGAAKAQAETNVEA